jgi:hypothetical protein
MLTRDFQEGADYPLVRLEGQAPLGTFNPIDGVGQMGADYVEVIAPGVVTVTVNTDAMSMLGVGILGGESYLLSPVGGAVTIDTAAFENSYVIVMNLERAHGPTNCHFSDYSLSVAEGGTPQIPFQVLPATNFAPPRVDGLED